METQEKQGGENRRHPRQALIDHAYLFNTEKDYLGMIQNYSRGGIYVRAKSEADVGDELHLLIARPENGGKFSIERTVIVRKEALGLALKFLDESKIKAVKVGYPFKPHAVNRA